MAWDEDRRRARERLLMLEEALDRSWRGDESDDTRLSALAAAASAGALLVFADALEQSVRNLQDEVIPQLKDALGDRQSP